MHSVGSFVQKLSMSHGPQAQYLVINHNADPSHVDARGLSALDIAQTEGHLAMVQFLREELRFRSLVEEVD